MTMEHQIFTVRAFPRQGFDCFFRGGHKWPVDGRTVFITEALYKVLRKERNLAVETPSEEDAAKVEPVPLDLVDNFCSDREHNDTREAREENSKLKAKLEVQTIAEENERLREALSDSEELREARLEHARLVQEIELRRLRAEAEAMKRELEQPSQPDANPKGDDTSGGKSSKKS